MAPLDYSKWEHMDDIKAALEDGDEDIGQVGGLVPEGAEVSAKKVGEEMISRVTLTGPNAADFVLQTMQQDPREEVQAKGCLALSQIAEKPEGRTALRKNGGIGIEVVVAAMMSAQPEEVEVQAHGCSALANLAIDEGETLVIAKSGLDAVLESAKTLLKEVTVQRKACLALGNLAFGSEGEAKVLASGGIETVVAAMNAHRKDPVVQEEGIDALVNIADSPDGKKRLLECGGLDVVANAQKHPKCAAVAADLAKQLTELRGSDGTLV
jgi:hypothetical protein